MIKYILSRKITFDYNRLDQLRSLLAILNASRLNVSPWFPHRGVSNNTFCSISGDEISRVSRGKRESLFVHDRDCTQSSISDELENAKRNDDDLFSKTNSIKKLK